MPYLYRGVPKKERTLIETETETETYILSRWEEEEGIMNAES